MTWSNGCYSMLLGDTSMLWMKIVGYGLGRNVICKIRHEVYSLGTLGRIRGTGEWQGASAVDDIIHGEYLCISVYLLGR